ncbi:MAG: reprolysin-like metallopeptidase [Saprospiraceae bacterium]
MRHTLFCLCLLLSTSFLFGQSQLFTPTAEGMYDLDLTALYGHLRTAPAEPTAIATATAGKFLRIPGPAGEQLDIEVWQTALMQPGLAARFPAIRTYIGRLVKDRRTSFRIDLSPAGFHLMAYGPQGTWLINPGTTPTTGYRARWKADFERPAEEFSCLTQGRDSYQPPTGAADGARFQAPYLIGDTLRVYRLAVITTGEYGNYHGGTPESILAAVVTTVNRVTGVYERDLSVRMILVDSLDKVFYSDPATDPYDGGSELSIGHNTLIDSIGVDSFDIGHTFDSGSGGVAFLGCVCDDDIKGFGYTGLTPPVGDPFDIDYVAHEMGHQFDGNHTFNECGGSGPQDYEPGSGVTIMGYAGLCGGDNIALNSIDQFHAGNQFEMTQFIQFGNGNTCPTKIATGNTPPQVSIPEPSNLVLPVSTPFELRAAGSDADGDSITYSWEQYDKGPTSPLGEPSGNAPLFRNYLPTADPVRLFPRLSTVLAGSNDIREVLPFYTRGMRFRVVVRDNNPAGGGIAWSTIQLQVDDAAGPFRVTSQSEQTTWNAGSFQTVTWDVADTDLPPVAADSVDIYLSADGGLTWPDTLGRFVNAGQALVNVPDDADGADYRVKVKGADHVFLQINRSAITVIPAIGPGFALGAVQNLLEQCGPDTLTNTLLIAGINGAGPLVALTTTDLPEGITLDLPADSVDVAQVNFPFSIAIGEEAENGTYLIGLIATRDSVSDTTFFTVDYLSGPPAAPALVGPFLGAVDISVLPLLEWMSTAADAYRVEIATDEDFDDIIYTADNITDTFLLVDQQLADSTTYFWRVRASSEFCGTGEFGESSSFQTEGVTCITYLADDLPKSFSAAATVTSRIRIDDDYPIRDLNVINLRGNNTDAGELNMRLIGPGGLNITLADLDFTCNNDNFLVAFDDEVSQTLNCARLNDDIRTQPANPLAEANGTSTDGVWRMFLLGSSGSTGELNEWGLEVCVPAYLISGLYDSPLDQSAFRVFPNPGRNLMQISWRDAAVAPASVELTDALGRRLIQRSVNQPLAVAGDIQLATGALPGGLYFYRLIDVSGRLLASGKWLKN